MFKKAKKLKRSKNHKIYIIMVKGITTLTNELKYDDLCALNYEENFQ